MSNKELLRCPYCGGEAKYNYSDGYYYIICDECGARNFGFSEEQAFDEWNSRIITKLTRSDIEKMVKPIEWNGWRGKLEAFSFSIIENEMSAFEVCFGKDCINGHYIDTSSTIYGAKSLAQAFLVDLICSVLGVKE